MNNRKYHTNLLVPIIKPGFKHGVFKDILKDSFFPWSFSLWVVLGYMALVIIRPWEILFPWLGAIRFELLYFFFMAVVVLGLEKKDPILSGQSFVVFIFSCVLLMSAFFGYDWATSWNTIYVFMAFLLFYFFLVALITTPYKLVFSVIFYVFVMTIYLGKSQWEFWIHGRHRYDMGVVRLTGIETSYGGPNALAMSIVVSLPFLLLLWRHRHYITAQWPEKWSKRFTLFVRLYGFLAVSSILMTNSRSGLVGLVGFLLLAFLGMRGVGKKIGYFLLCCCMAGIVWLTLPQESQNRIISIWEPDVGPANAQASAQGRIEGLKAGLIIFKENPFLGVGPGNFADYRVEHIDGINLRSHNLAGQSISELGLLGTFAFSLLIGITLINCAKIKRTALKIFEQPQFWIDFSVACRNSILLLLLLGIFGHNLFRYNWLWVAVFASKAIFFLNQYRVINKGG